MSYQSLLFCPDEKTARTVTQVLTELEFTVEACSEPFAAVKKLMGEHFDAIVVDCDNEQNATLLFKSARNSTSNQASLAVAVVEGQAGVAKAFRIGANLVLTKPINVEQAKGTLRVARGLLRKGEPAKPITPVATTPVPTKADNAAPIVRPAVRPPSSVAPTPRPSGPSDPSALWQVSNPTPSAGSPVTSSASAVHDQDPLDLGQETAPAAAKVNAAAASPTGFKPAVKNVPVPPISKSVPVVSSSSSSAETKGPLVQDLVKVSTPASRVASVTGKPAFGTGAASAAAPARSPADSTVVEPATPKVASGADVPFEKASESGMNDSSGLVTGASSPSFSFGGADAPESSGGGSKRALLGVAAAAVVAAGLYMGWTQFRGRTTATSSDSRPATPASDMAAHGSTSQPASVPMAPPPKSAATSSPSPQTTLQPKAAVKSVEKTASVADSDDTSDENAEPRAKGPAKISSNLAVAKPAPELKPAPAPIVMKKGVASPPQTLAPDAPAPSVMVAATSAGGSLPNLIGDPSISAKPVLQTLNISQGVSQGLLIKKVQPNYPPNALRMHVEGAVQLLATIGKSGNITAVKTLNGEPTLARAALEAVKQWKYKPYYLNGEPVEIQTQITVNFKLPH
jgi:TonB family protein